MSNWELLMAGIKLLIFGMGMVYVFLILMILVMKMLKKTMGPGTGVLLPETRPVQSPKEIGPDLGMVAAAVAAVHAARNGHPASNPAAAKQTTASPQTPTVETVVMSPLPGTIIRLTVQPGTAVAAGQTVMILEALKMETEIKAERPGVIRSFKVAAGQVVAMGEPLFGMEEK